MHLALLALLAGCANPVTTSDPTRLGANDGIIVYRMKCGPGVAWGQIFPSGESLRGFKAETRRAGILSCRDGMQVQVLPAGRYFVGKVGYRGIVDFAENAAMQIDVVPGKLNYIGHITLPSSLDMGKVLISDPFVADRHEEAQTWLAANQTLLQGQYPFVAALARSPSNVATSEVAEESAAEFTVVLKLRVDEAGSVREGHIAKSSGNINLDDTALAEAVRNWQVAPVPAGNWGNYAVTYRLAN